MTQLPKAGPTRAPHPRRLHVLFVEDELADVDLCVLELKRAGYEVAYEVVQTRAAFTAAVHGGAFDLAIADYRLPSWTGFEAVEMLRQDGNDLPVVLVTGTLGEEAAVECVKRGAADYVLKDRLARLPFAVRRALEEKRLRRERRQAEEEREQLLREMGERVKELTCITLVSKSLSERTRLEDIFQDVAGLLPMGYQHSDLACARVRFNGQQFISGDFGESPWRQSADLALAGTTVGTLEVFYRQPLPPADDGPFLKEERALLDTVVRALCATLERRRAEEALRASEAQYRELFEMANDAILIFEPDSEVILEANPRARDMYGFGDKLVGVSLKRLTRDVARGEAQIQDLLREGRCQNFESVHFRQDGSPFHVLASSTVIEYAGRTAILTVNRDITLRKQAEEALRRARDELERRVEERTAELGRLNRELRQARDEWQRTFDCMSDGISCHDQTYNILRCNRAFRDLFPGREVETLKCYQLVHGLEAPPDFCPLAKTLNSRASENCEVFEPHLGRWLSVRTDPLPEEDGRLVRVVHSLRDISERKRTEEEQARLVAILEASSEFVATIDMGGRLRYLNAAARAMVGIGEDEGLAAIDPLVFLPQDGSDSLAREALAATLAGGSWSGEATLHARDGRQVPVLAESVAHRDTAGGIQFVSVVAHDITQRKQVERMKTEFVATVSHELRTPLASLRGFAELLLQHDYDDAKRRQFLAIIQNESDRLAKLINDFLDIQRLESGPPPLRFQLLDLDALMRESAALFSGSALHAIRLEVEPGLPAVRGDADAIRQVLANLLSNAIKYSPCGGDVCLGARRAQGDVLLWISDHGIGIPADAQAQLFTRFYRVEGHRHLAAGGTGLGLALVKQIVQSHGGKVWVESASGKGSTFSVRLPVAECEDAPAAAEQERQAATP